MRVGGLDQGGRVIYRRSQTCYERAYMIPGASLTRSKAPGHLFAVGSGPLYVASGVGATILDVDGNEYIDMICALGAISLGYGATGITYPAPTVYSLPSPLEAEAA